MMSVLFGFRLPQYIELPFMGKWMTILRHILTSAFIVLSRREILHMPVGTTTLKILYSLDHMICTSSPQQAPLDKSIEMVYNIN